MAYIERTARGLGLLAVLSRDRVLYFAAVLFALSLGAYFGTL